MRPFRKRPSRRSRPSSSRIDGYAWRVGQAVTSFHSAAWDDCRPEAERVLVTLAFVSLYHRPIASLRDLPAEVSIAFDVRTDMGAWTQVIVSTWQGKSRARFCRSVTIERPADSAGKPWGFRVRRLTPDIDPTRHSKFYLDSVRQEGADGRFLSPSEGEAA